MYKYKASIFQSTNDFSILKNTWKLKISTKRWVFEGLKWKIWYYHPPLGVRRLYKATLTWNNTILVVFDKTIFYQEWKKKDKRMFQKKFYLQKINRWWFKWSLKKRDGTALYFVKHFPKFKIPKTSTKTENLSQNIFLSKTLSYCL